MTAPPLAVVIPSYSRADLLTRCLETVTAHAPPGTEVIVVDDASPDGVISRTASQFPGVRTIRLPRRSGFCVAANAGVRAATAPVVELLNDDTEVSPGWADAAVRWFADPAVVAVAPLVLQLDPQRPTGSPPLIDSAGDEYDLGGFARKRWHGDALTPGPSPTRLADSAEERGGRGPLVFSPSPPVLAEDGFRGRGGRGVRADLQPGSVWGVSATAGFYRRSALLAVGLFPEHFGAYFEDVDLSHRLRAVGDIRFDPAAVVWHRVSASYGRTPNRRVLEQQSCNEERVFWRNVRGRALWRHLPRHAAVLVGKAVRRLREGRFVPWAVGRLRAWCGQ